MASPQATNFLYRAPCRLSRHRKIGAGRAPLRLRNDGPSPGSDSRPMVPIRQSAIQTTSSNLRALKPFPEMPMEIVLYYAPNACSLVPYVTLTEANANFEVRALNLRKEQQRSA